MHSVRTGPDSLRIILNGDDLDDATKSEIRSYITKSDSTIETWVYLSVLANQERPIKVMPLYQFNRAQDLYVTLNPQGVETFRETQFLEYHEGSLRIEVHADDCCPKP